MTGSASMLPLPVMSITTTNTTTTAATQLLRGARETYAYRRVGGGIRRPLICLQHFTGTLDNWDRAVIDPLTPEREVILFDSAGVGRSTGKVPTTVAGMAAQQIATERPSIVHRMILVGTAPRGGEDIMRLDKPSLATPLGDPTLTGYAVLQKIFFAPTSSSQAAGAAFIERLAERKEDVDRASGPEVAGGQMMAFREWEQGTT